MGVVRDLGTSWHTDPSCPVPVDTQPHVHIHHRMLRRWRLDPAPHLVMQPVGHHHDSLVPALALHLTDPHAANSSRGEGTYFPLPFFGLACCRYTTSGLRLALADRLKMTLPLTFVTRSTPSWTGLFSGSFPRTRTMPRPVTVAASFLGSCYWHSCYWRRGNLTDPHCARQ